MEPYAGLRVVEWCAGEAGALAGMLLADAGASVTMVHPPAGHPLAARPGFLVWARDKRSVALDPTTDAGRDELRTLLADADLFIDDRAPGELEELGLAPDDLRAAYPRLVHTSITATGPAGPWRDLPADEALVTAVSGAMRMQPGFREGPVSYVLPFASVAAALLVLHGAGSALLQRERTGAGARVETSLYAGSLAMAGSIFRAENPPPPIIPKREPVGSRPLYRLYQAQDGRWLHIGGLTPRFWPRVALAIGQPELISDPRFQYAPDTKTDADRRALIDILAAAFDTRPFAEWDRILDEHDIPYAPSMTVDEFIDDPQLRQQGLIETVEDAAVGRLERISKVLTFVGEPTSPPTPFPGAERGNEPDRPTMLNRVAPLLAGEGQAQRAGVGFAPRGHAEGAGAAGFPLSGVRIVDVSGFIAGPYGGAFLADLGADVIKVEGPEGDGLRPNLGFVGWNRGKRGVCLNLQTEGGREAYLRMCDGADVVLENMRPGVAERLGVGYDTIRARNPGVVYCYVSAYGPDGPYRHKPGFDPLMQARSGIERAQGGLENPPVFLAPPVTDNATAMMNAAGILIALYGRERTGEGSLVQTSLMASSCLLQSESLMRYEGRPSRPVNDREQFGPSAIRRLYRLADGWLMLALAGEDDWTALCNVLERADLRDDARFATAEARRATDADLATALTEAFARRELAPTFAALRERGVAAAPATGPGTTESVDDPHLAANGLIATLPHGQYGTVMQPSGLVRVDGLPTAAVRSAPLLGEQTVEVLREAGLTTYEIDALLASGAAIQSGSE